jgi:hypothetical protein
VRRPEAMGPSVLRCSLYFMVAQGFGRAEMPFTFRSGF